MSQFQSFRVGSYLDGLSAPPQMAGFANLTAR
jgi:hypothetical protein